MISSRPHALQTLLLAVGFILAALNPVHAADDTVDTRGKVPTADDIRQGLFPDDECQQLKDAGFKCMGFKPAVRFSIPAANFKVGSAELPEGVRRQLDSFAEVLRSRTGTDAKVRLEGHADASGDSQANLELSQRRAESAKSYLVAKGVNPDLLHPVGMGARELLNPANPTAAENRRVVIGRETGDIH